MKSESKTVKLSELSIDPSNVRKTGRGTEPQYAASIRVHGVLEPLIVRRGPDVGYLITNGGERFTALQFLKKKGDKAAGVTVTDDFGVRVEIVDRDDAAARAVSLATNLIRSDMHPVDEFEAFAARIKDGATVDELAAEYARIVPEIRQALSLAAIAPEIRAAWRDGKIEGDAAEAYAQTKDLEHQVRVFKKLKGQAGEKWKVVDEIAGSRAHELGKLLKFVGEKEFEAAGHHVNPSLFAEDERHDVAIDNVPALKAMAAAKIAAECARLKKDGWSWAIPKNDAPKDLYAWRRIDSNPKKGQKALAGCTVDVNYDGKFEIVRGYVKPGVSIRVEKTKAEKAAARKAGPAKLTTISAALADRLSVALTKATAATVAKLDLDSVLRIAIAGILSASSFSDSPVCLENKGMGVRGDDNSDYDFPSELSRLAKMDRPALFKLFGQVVASSIDLQHSSATRMLIANNGDVEDEGAAALINFMPQKLLQIALRAEFDADAYFESAPGAMAQAAIADMRLIPLKNAPKAAWAKMASDCTKKTGWLPPQLRTKGYEGPKAKPAPKKKAKTAGRKKRQ